jgi:hypothetical protein
VQVRLFVRFSQPALRLLTAHEVHTFGPFSKLPSAKRRVQGLTQRSLPR